MKAITLFFLMTLPIFVFSQNENFTFTKDGLSEYVVVEIDSISEKELYSKTLNWVKETYIKPEQVIDATIENESIRVTGKSNFFRIYNAFGDFKDYPVKYTIKISFKKGKYKFEVLSLSVEHDSVNYSDIPSKIYKKNGELLKWYKDTPLKIEDFFNQLNTSLKGYIIKNEKSDW
jgi:hypothetical protein